MTQTDKSSLTKRLAQGIGVISILMLVGAVVLELMNLRSLNAGELFLLAFSLDALPAAVLGLLILSRQPGHGMGRLLLAIGFIFSWFMFSYAVEGNYETELVKMPGMIGLFVFVGAHLYLLPIMMTMGLIPLYFPDGRLLSPRWRPVSVLVWTGLTGAALLQALLDLYPRLPQLAELISESALERLFEAFIPLFILGTVAALASLVLRFIRARGDDRIRMKWLVYTAVVSISLILLMLVFFSEDNYFVSVFSALLTNFLTISIGIAILRHRLWDIDIIIRRTLSYAALTGLLALVYFGGVVLLQNIFDALAGQHESPLITVLSTLAIAALFNPLRTRIQDFIDRRFYRQKYDAERTLARFSAAARDEVDLENLADALLGTVEETMQPERISLWIRDTGRAG